MNKTLATLICFLLLSAPFSAHAQQGSSAIIYATCASAPYGSLAGKAAALTMDVNGNLCTSATGGGGGGTVSQGTAAAASGAWPVYDTDGAGTILGVTAHPLRIDPTGTTTQPVSLASSPLPTGAATAANQTAVQSAAGSAASTLQGVQGNASGVPLPAIEPDGSAACAPVAASGTGSGTGTNTVLFTVNTCGYSSIAIQATAIGTSNTISYEGSNDNVTFNGVFCAINTNTSTTLGTFTSATTTAGTSWLVCPVVFNYFRARISVYSSGTPALAYSLRKNYQAIQSVPNATVTTNAAAVATGGYSFSNISTNATTTVKSGAGTLHSIVLNNPGSVETLTVYDNTAASGTKIGTIVISANSTLIYDLAFSNGLTIVSAGTTAADITVTYK